MNERASFTGEELDCFSENRQAIEDIAIQLWKARETLFPERVRRLKPDAIDMATGAWETCVKEAIAQLRKRH